MTFSLVARCPRTGQFGVAAATGAMAVGKLVSYACANTGAVATQAFVNPYLGIDALPLLREGRSAAQVIQEMLSRDPEPQKRQLAIIDREGGVAAWSGSNIAVWSGHRQEDRDSFCVQGNRLAGKQVLDAAAEAFLRNEDDDLAHRLLRAMEAADQAGGDTCGEKSATLLVYDTEEYPLWDIRVDLADDPVVELRRLFDIFEVELLPKIRKLPTRSDYHDGFESQDDELA